MKLKKMTQYNNRLLQQILKKLRKLSNINREDYSSLPERIGARPQNHSERP
jgi:DNA-binding HxlR family transcriptional regulator